MNIRIIIIYLNFKSTRSIEYFSILEKQAWKFTINFFVSHSAMNVPRRISHVRDWDVGCASFDKCLFYF